MARKLYPVVLLLAGCIALAGCPSADKADKKAPPAPGATERAEAPEDAAAIAEPSEPSVRYLASEEMAPAVIVAGHPLAYTRQILPLDAEGKLVGEGSAEKQVEQVLANLEAILAVAGSGLGELVKVNVYADSPQTADLFQERLAKRLEPPVRPAVCAVTTPLPIAEALVAVDAVAIASEGGDTVVLHGGTDVADAAVMPAGGAVYLSGQPDKSPLAEATVNSMNVLLEVAGQLELDRSQIVELKVFVDSMTEHGAALNELKKLFAGETLPPVTFVEWIASAPVEIEVVLFLPRSRWESADPVRFYTPPGVKPSPTFSRVALVQTDRQIYISGLSAREAGDAEFQVRDVFAQLQQILEQTGSDLTHLSKATYYVSQDDASAMLGKLRPEYYDPQRPPAASLAKVHGVARADRALTMDMIAVGAEK